MPPRASKIVEEKMADSRDTVEHVFKAGQEAATRNAEQVLTLTKSQFDKVSASMSRNFDDVSAFGKDNVDAVLKATAAWAKGWEDLGREVFGFTTRMFLAFGVAFELPILVLFLSLAGILSAGQLLRGTPYAILGIFIAAAILTPSPDWVSQVLLGVPMVILYLVGVGVAWLFGRRKQAAEAAQAAVQKV